MDDAAILTVLDDAANAVRAALDELSDWGPAGTRPGQYRSDLAADEACLAVLDRAGFGWLSEETGIARSDRAMIVVVDPVDGSTNAARGLPWYATSLCVVDDAGARAALVVNQATGRRFRAVRGGGATADGVPITPTTVTTIGDAIIGLSGLPREHLGWRQFRAMNAAALDLCAVAEGALDGFVDCSPSAHGVWDYAAGLLVCAEVGIEVQDAFGRDLLVLDHGARRTPVAAATPELLATLVQGRRDMAWDDDPVLGN